MEANTTSSIFPGERANAISSILHQLGLGWGKKPSASTRPWAADPEEEAEKPEEGVEAEPLSPSSKEAWMQKPVHKWGWQSGLAEGTRL